MGGDWHIPTFEQIEELINETNHEWVTDYQGSSVNGMLFTSKTDSSKSIFIPAAGYGVDFNVDAQGDYYCLWSSSLCVGDNYHTAWRVESAPGVCELVDSWRSNGASLRGVIG